ncbi:Jacalin-related lectin 19-like protein [Drosera capensis]
MQDQQRGKMKIAVGPWGGQGGVSWDDGTYHGIREITLVYGRCIDSISFVYDKNGKAIKSEKHGGMGGTKTAEIKLNYPEEYIVSVSGYCSPVIRGGTPVIRSLTFKTNKRTFGPYGPEEGTPFAFPMDGGKIIGFKGRNGWYLDAIGFHVARVQSTNLTKRLQQWLQRSLDPKNSKESLNGKNAKVYA